MIVKSILARAQIKALKVDVAQERKNCLEEERGGGEKIKTS